MIGVVGAIFAPQLLALMGASPGVIANASFTRVMLGGNASVVLLFLINSVFRELGGCGDGDARRSGWRTRSTSCSARRSCSGGVRCRSSVWSAPRSARRSDAATGVLYALTRLRQPASRVRLHAHHFGLDVALIARVVRLSSAATFQVFVGMASWIGLVRILASFGSDALAGYTIGIRIVMFALLPSFGMSNAAATMVGQALGAKKPERAEAAVWKTARYNAVFLAVIGLAFVVFARQIVGGFTQDPNVAQYGVIALRRSRTGSCSTRTGW